jgi:hypothetical protein
MALKSKIWMTGSLEWYTFIDDEEVYLGRHEVPVPLEEGDAWTNELGQMFRVIHGLITLVGTTDPPRRCW